MIFWNSLVWLQIGAHAGWTTPLLDLPRFSPETASYPTQLNYSILAELTLWCRCAQFGSAGLLYWLGSFPLGQTTEVWVPLTKCLSYPCPRISAVTPPQLLWPTCLMAPTQPRIVLCSAAAKTSLTRPTSDVWSSNSVWISWIFAQLKTSPYVGVLLLSI